MRCSKGCLCSVEHVYVISSLLLAVVHVGGVCIVSA